MLRPFLNEIQQQTTKEVFKKIECNLLSTEEWIEVEKLTAILKPFDKYTKLLQKKACCLSEFYGYWLSMQIAMKRFGDDDLANFVLEEMKVRENQLFENPVMTSCIYLDPRYQRTLNEQQKKLAVYFLAELNKKIDAIEASNERNTDTDEVGGRNQSIVSDHSENDLESYLNELGSNIQTREDSHSEPRIDQILKEFDGTNGSLKVSVMEYWEQEKNAQPRLYRLASIILAVQATQTSVERCFSAFNLVYSSRRTKLSDENLQNILLIKLNDF